MKGSLLVYNLKLNCLIISTGLNSSLIILTYTVNCQNALDRLRVRMNIILFKYFHWLILNKVNEKNHVTTSASDTHTLIHLIP